MLNNTGHINAKFIDFSDICQKKSSEIGCFLLIVLLPLKIPQNFAFFSAKYQKPCDEKQRQLQFIQKQILAASFTSSLSFWKTLSVRQSSIKNRNYYQF